MKALNECIQPTVLRIRKYRFARRPSIIGQQKTDFFREAPPPNVPVLGTNDGGRRGARGERLQATASVPFRLTADPLRRTSPSCRSRHLPASSERHGRRSLLPGPWRLEAEVCGTPSGPRGRFRSITLGYVVQRLRRRPVWSQARCPFRKSVASGIGKPSRLAAAPAFRPVGP